VPLHPDPVRVMDCEQSYVYMYVVVYFSTDNIAVTLHRYTDMKNTR